MADTQPSGDITRLTVAPNLQAATLLKNALDEAGIPAHLQNVYSEGVFGDVAALAMPEVWVRSEHLDAAIKLMNDHEHFHHLPLPPDRHGRPANQHADPHQPVPPSLPRPHRHPI
jgi:hypothetical protein